MDDSFSEDGVIQHSQVKHEFRDYSWDLVDIDDDYAYQFSPIGASTLKETILKEEGAGNSSLTSWK